MKFKDLFPATDHRVRIEFRLFEVTLLLTVMVFLFWSVYGFFVGYSFAIQTVYVGGLIIYSGFYYAYKKGVSFNLLATLYYLIGFSMLAYSWLPSGGFSGAIMSMFVLLYVSGLLILPLRAYLIFITSLIVLVILFAVIELNDPEAAIPYPDKPSLIKDLAIAYLIMLSIIGLALFIFKRAFIRDRRTLNDTIEELALEKEKAEAADRAKTQFLAMISHEMRTPLNGIVGITELLQETRLDESQEELLKNLSYSSSVLHSLISDVLDLTLIEDGKLMLQDLEIRVQKELNNLIEMLRPRLSEKKKEIRIEYLHDDQIPKILTGDLHRIRQVLINLINNAIKFTNEGYIKVESKLLERKKGICTVQFVVTDTGIGISEDHKEKLFNKFFRAESGYEIEGTGLGLSISKTIAELMGGEIGFDSEKGKGSEFRFTIPLTEGQQQPKATEQATASFEDKLTGLKVLIAEDVKVNQLVITKMLQRIGVKDIDIAENGQQAVDMALAESYDFIFMDVQMPVLDGIEASRKILSSVEHAEEPIIIAVTANAMIEDLRACKKAGMQDFISKPFTSEILTNIFYKYV